MLHGILNIDKPAGMTSHDVVARVRRASGERRVGHAGTLDPAATGVLVVALGQATRLIEYIQDQTIKRYLAVVAFGSETDTEDAEGRVVAEAPAPTLGRADLAGVLAGFVGEIMQVPPMFSALHHEGRRLHELAREGATVELAPRPVRVERIDVVAWEPPLLTLDVLCGKGTYVRSLARDIGRACGSAAHLASLRRTAVGEFRAEGSVALADLAGEGRDPARVAAALLPPEAAVAGWPRADLDERAERLVRNGVAVALDLPGARARAHGRDGRLLALLAGEGGLWRPEKVFDWGSA